MAEIDAYNRYLTPANEVDRAEQGAVATNGKEEVVMALGQGVYHFFGLNSVVVKDVAELLVLLAVGFFDIARV